MSIDEEPGNARSNRSASRTLAFEWRDGDREEVRTNEDESILDAAEAAGVNLPFGCRIGVCTTCTGRVRDGTVVHSRPPRGLDPRHLVDGYALLCIAEARTDCRIEVGADVQSTLTPNPWK